MNEVMGDRQKDLRRAQLGYARAAAVTVPGIALLVLVGWLADIPVLTSLLPQAASMRANTALALLLLGGALWLTVREEARDQHAAHASPWVLVLALPAGAIAALTLCQYVSAQDLGLDWLLGSLHRLDATQRSAARMAPVSAFAVLLGAFAIAPLGWRLTRRGPWPQRMASLLALAMLMVIYGYLFDAPLLYHIPDYPPIALHTAIALVLLAIGVLFATGNRGWVAELSLATPASSAGRRTLVLLVTAIPLVGWLRLLGQRLGLYGWEVGLAIMCVSFTAAIALLQWLTVRRANVDDRSIERLTRLYAMLSQTNQAIVRCPDETVLYRRLCELAVEHGRFAHAWVGVLDRGTAATWVAASAGAHAACAAAGDAPWPYAERLHDGRLLSNVSPADGADALPWFGAARRAGLVTLAVPFRRGAEVQGALNLYATDPDFFGDYALPTLEEMGLDMSFALDNLHREADRTAAVAALRVSELRYQELAAEVPVGLFRIAVGPAGQPRFEYANPPLCAFFGLDLDAVRAGQDWALAMILPEDRPVMARLRDAYLHAEGPVSADMRFQVGDAVRTLRMIARRTAVDGDTHRWSGVMVDITEQAATERERDRLRAQLVQAQRMEAIGQLTGGIAHDFNNILGSVLGFATLALDREIDDPDGKLAQYLGEVQRGAERARDLVAKMLKFSRGVAPAAGGDSIAPAAELDEVLKLLGSVLPASIAVTRRYEAGLPPLALDAVEFHQLVMNLAINARDALNGAGRIEFGLAHTHIDDGKCSACGRGFDGNFVALSVADDGPGIADADLARIFLPFYTTKSADKGTGLGLAMVHGIVHQVGGHLLVDSRPGAGARFRLLFPADGVAAAPPETAPPDTQMRAAPGARIMVVDDEPALVRLWTELLEGAGYIVSTHGDGAAALAAFDAAPDAVDAMVLDMTMPILSGDRLAREVLARRPELPVFVCTGYSDRLDTLLARSIGIRGVFTKPLDFDDILARIGAALAA